MLLKLENISQLSVDLGTVNKSQNVFIFISEKSEFLFTAIFKFFMNTANIYYLTLIAIYPAIWTNYSVSP